MATVYEVTDGGRSVPLERVRVSNEDKELQRLLEQNHDLLPGDQIDPLDPCRWLLIKREMSVPDPGTGADRWSVDFVFADQKGIPTFVECKRLGDTRSRREVVAQMLDYAANGHHYWTGEQLRVEAQATASSSGADIEDVVHQLNPDEEADPRGFFERVEVNLRSGKLRLIFFLEEAPHELRSIVEFLNGQMQRSEVLIVQAQQFEREGRRIVVPSLFGFTEEARTAKLPPVSTTSRRRRWNRQDFLHTARDALGDSEYAAVESILELVDEPGAEVTWGTGAQTGSFGLVVSAASNKSIITVWTDGTLTLQLGWLHTSERAKALRDELREATRSIGLEFKDTKYPNVNAEKWVPHVVALRQALLALIGRYRD